jgi:tetratricopeptide (TPR) repeat protein
VQEGQILRNEGKNKEAEKAFQKVLSLNSRSAPALFNIAELDKDNEPAKAKGLLLKAIAANKSFAPPYKTLGYMVKDDNPCLAEKYWKQFVALTPSDDDRKEIQQEIENAGCDR